MPEIHEALRAYTDDAPPPTFTLDQVLTAGRRRRRVRRIGVVAGVAVVVAAGFALPLRASEPVPVAAPPAELLPACRTGTDVPPDGPNYPVPGAAERMTCYLVGAVPAALPGATFSRDPGGKGAPLEAYAGRVFDPARPEETSPPYFSAGAVVSDANGVGTIGFGAAPWQAMENCSLPECTVRTGPHGETVTVLDTVGSNGYRVVNIRIHRGRSEIFVSAANGILATPVEPGRSTTSEDYRVGREDLPLGIDQLIALGAVPELQLFR